MVDPEAIDVADPRAARAQPPAATVVVAADCEPLSRDLGLADPAAGSTSYLILLEFGGLISDFL